MTEQLGTGRLGPATLPTVVGRPGVDPPRVDPAGLRVGIVHLGLGAFHRAHQAIFTEDALAASGGDEWGICGVTQRSDTVARQLVPQDGLYSVLRRDAGPPAARVVGVLREVHSGAGGLPPAVRDRLADPAVRVVTVTVTEPGYRIGAGGGLDHADPGTAADLAGVGADLGRRGPGGYRPVTVVGQLAAGLALRYRRHGAGLSLLSCDNLSHNGVVLRRLVTEFCAALPADGLTDWLAAQVRFPSSMVDRIVPATRDEDLAEAARLLGVADAGAVAAEPFRQWVIEDDFPAGRPPWEAAGAILTTDVTEYEQIKLRLLNASHSLLAYLGALAGYDTIADAVRDPALAAEVERFMVADALPTLTAPPGLDLTAYRGQLLDRFANPALRHRTVQVAQDGSLKLPIRLTELIRHRLAAGAAPTGAALIIAGWVVYAARGSDRRGRPLPLVDPLAKTIQAGYAGRTTPAALVAAAFALPGVFPADLAADRTLRSLVTEQVARLLTESGGLAV